MGNQSSNPQKKNRQDQIIVSASKVKRKCNTSSGISSGLGILKHVGIKVVTDENEEYVIHHTGYNGDVVTQPAHVMYGEGYEEERITVRNQITIRDAEYAGGKGGSYFGNGTCIGVADKIQKRLEG
ncbi:unnamed protein product [Paramecium sonneborni]|uniref:Uncharacterized protein n=1 Tax=Paramecium sonneborni TaxID=65129 RepID=A0A8S1M9Q7_9CILI|nr:unnamed protein product [Paramecium sonneborni]